MVGTFESVSIVPPSNGAATKHHLVLRQRSRLIREDVLDLSEILVDIEGTALEGSIRGSIVHLPVPVDEVDLNELDDLHGYVEGDRDDHLRRGWGDGEGCGRRVSEDIMTLLETLTWYKITKVQNRMKPSKKGFALSKSSENGK